MKKKFLSIFLALLMILSLMPTAIFTSFATETPGSSKDNPMLISSYADLNNFADNVNSGNNYSGKYIKLSDNFPTDSGSLTKPIGNYPKKAFSGNFDGNNKTVNLSIDNSNPGSDSVYSQYSAMFGYVARENGDKIIIKNINLKGTVKSTHVVSSLIAYAFGNISVINCGSNVEIYSVFQVPEIGNDVMIAGGLIGLAVSTNKSDDTNDSIEIYNSYYNGTIHLKNDNYTTKKPCGVRYAGICTLTRGKVYLNNCYAVVTFDVTANQDIENVQYNYSTGIALGNSSTDYFDEAKDNSKATVNYCYSNQNTNTNAITGTVQGCEKINNAASLLSNLNSHIPAGFDCKGWEIRTGVNNGYPVFPLLKSVVNVNLDANGGTFGTTSTKELPSTLSGSTYSTVDLTASEVIPTRENFKFLGWFTSATGGNLVTSFQASSSVQNDVTYYAQWAVDATVTVIAKTDKQAAVYVTAPAEITELSLKQVTFVNSNNQERGTTPIGGKVSGSKYTWLATYSTLPVNAQYKVSLFFQISGITYKSYYDVYDVGATTATSTFATRKENASGSINYINFCSEEDNSIDFYALFLKTTFASEANPWDFHSSEDFKSLTTKYYTWVDPDTGIGHLYPVIFNATDTNVGTASSLVGNVTSGTYFGWNEDVMIGNEEYAPLYNIENYGFRMTGVTGNTFTVMLNNGKSDSKAKGMIYSSSYYAGKDTGDMSQYDKTSKWYGIWYDRNNNINTNLNANVNGKDSGACFAIYPGVVAIGEARSYEITFSLGLNSSNGVQNAMAPINVAKNGTTEYKWLSEAIADNNQITLINVPFEEKHASENSKKNVEILLSKDVTFNTLEGAVAKAINGDIISFNTNGVLCLEKGTLTVTPATNDETRIGIKGSDKKIHTVSFSGISQNITATVTEKNDEYTATLSNLPKNSLVTIDGVTFVIPESGKIVVSSNDKTFSATELREAIIYGYDGNAAGGKTAINNVEISTPSYKREVWTGNQRTSPSCENPTRESGNVGKVTIKKSDDDFPFSCIIEKSGDEVTLGGLLPNINDLYTYPTYKSIVDGTEIEVKRTSDGEFYAVLKDGSVELDSTVPCGGADKTPSESGETIFIDVPCSSNITNCLSISNNSKEAINVTKNAEDGTYTVTVPFGGSVKFNNESIYTNPYYKGDLIINISEEGEITIVKRTPCADDFTFAAPSDLVYSASDKEATITPKDCTERDIEYSYHTSYPFQVEDESEDHKAVDSYYVGIYIDEDDYYESGYVSSEDWTFDISKKTPTVDDFSFEAPEILSYDSTNKTATIETLETIEGMGEISWKYYSNANCTSEVTDTSLPGTYYVALTVEDGSNYSDTTLKSSDWSFTVTKTKVLLSVESASAIYDGNGKAPLFKLIDGERTAQQEEYVLNDSEYSIKYYQKNANMGTLNYSTPVNQCVTADNYLFVITLTETDYYEWMTQTGKTTLTTVNSSTLMSSSAYVNAGIFTIGIGSKSQTPISFNLGEVEAYVTDEDITEPTLKNDNSGATVTYSSGNTSVATVDSSTGEITIVGSGKVKITAKSVMAEAADVYASYDILVSKLPITVTVDSLTGTNAITYGDSVPSYTLSYSVDVDGYTHEIDKTKIEGTTVYSGYSVGKDVGTHSISVKGLSSKIYSISYLAGSLEVKQKELASADFSVTANNKVYDGTQNATGKITVTGGLVGSDKLSVIFDSASFDSADKADSKTVTFTGVELSGSKAGNYKIASGVTFTATANIKAATQNTFAITGLSNTVTYGDVITLGDTGAAGTVTYTVESGSAQINGTELKVIGTGSITVKATSSLTGYNDKVITKTVTADKKQLTLSSVVTSREYDGTLDLAAENITVSVEGTVFSDVITATATGGTLKNADAGYTKSITVNGITIDGEKKDYYSAPSTNSATVDITPKTLKATDFTYSVSSKGYDATTSATVNVTPKDGVVCNSDDVKFTATGEFADANKGNGKSVNITLNEITGKKANNYVYSTVDTDLTATSTANITAMPISFTFGESTFKYDGDAKSVNVTATDDNNAVFKNFKVYYESDEYSKSETAPIVVGTYTVTAELLSDNYTVNGTNTATLTINPGEAVVFANETEQFFNGENKQIVVLSVPSINTKVTYYKVTDEGKVGEMVTPNAVGKYLYFIELDDTNYQLSNAASIVAVGDSIADYTVKSNCGILKISNNVQPTLYFNEPLVYKTYGDAPFTIGLTGGAEEKTLTYKSTDETVATVNETTGEITILKSGVTIIEVKSEAIGYDDTTARFALQVAKKNVTIELNSTSIDFTGNEIDIPYNVVGDVEGNKVKAEDIVFVYTNSENASDHSHKKAGLYTVTANLKADNEYYTVYTIAVGTLRIVKYDIGAYIQGSTEAETTDVMTFTAKFDGTLPEGTTVVWDYSGSAIIVYEGSRYGTDSVTIKCVTPGNFTFTATLVDENGNPIINSDGSFVQAEINVKVALQSGAIYDRIGATIREFFNKIKLFFNNLFKFNFK